MKIALLGYGKMGKEVEEVAISKNYQVFPKIDSSEDWEKNFEDFLKADVAIEFSTPNNVIENILRCFENNIPVVVGTTGWNNKLHEIINLCKEKNQTLFYASNFSIGVNIFFEINRLVSKLMKKFNEYNLTIEETHHLQKLDSPSGTAINLANDIIAETKRFDKWSNSENNDEKSLFIKSIREADIVGIHKIIYDSYFDKIELKHYAKNRKGFAIGAIAAAEFIFRKKGVYNMSDLLAF